MSISPESGLNIFEHPRGYFEAQVRFAQSWSRITGEELAEVFPVKTALYRRMVGAYDDGTAQAGWNEMLVGSKPDDDPEAVTNELYGAYKGNDSNRYDFSMEPESAFGYDYNPDTNTVKIHFINPRRGQKPFSDDAMPLRRKEFREMLQEVANKNPEAAILLSATWLRSTSSYRSLSPDIISPEQDLMSPDMKLTGNSVWGQFINASGNTNQRIFDQFTVQLAAARSTSELIAAFPYRTLLAADPIEAYYEFYNID